jgi:hypothetical protein
MKKQSIGLKLASMMAMFGGRGVMGTKKIINTHIDPNKYVMGKDTRTPKQRWSKPIFIKGKRTGFLIKFFDNTFQEVSCE